MSFLVGWKKSDVPLIEALRLYLYPYPNTSSDQASGPIPPWKPQRTLGADEMRQQSNQGDVKTLQKTTKFRTQYPFLSSPTCPPELKILAANKITAYQNYCTAHQQLLDCTNLDQQFTKVKQLVENFIENRKIFDEFRYYMEHGHTLGQHPVFKELQQIRELHQLSDLELDRKKRKLEHNIWRLQSEIAKKDKPHLQLSREKSITEKKQLLQSIEEILSRKNVAQK